ncbi:MAG: hypothetical protein ABSG31_07900 [Tepidisphaeraceae bacterium]|jgi:hypothetical protein
MIPVETYPMRDDIAAYITRTNSEASDLDSWESKWREEVAMREDRARQLATPNAIDELRIARTGRGAIIDARIKFLSRVAEEWPTLRNEARATAAVIAEEQYDTRRREIEEGLKDLGFKPLPAHVPGYCIFRLLAAHACHAELAELHKVVETARNLARQKLLPEVYLQEVAALQAEMEKLIATQ